MIAPTTSDYTDYTDVVVDLETLGDTPDSIPAQIGVLFFDLKDPHKPLTGGSADICPLSGREIGLVATESTLQWWQDKGLPIPGSNGNGMHLLTVIRSFALDFGIRAIPQARIWSRGNSFDLAILKLSYLRHGMDVPWQFWNECDVRSFLLARTGQTRGRPNNHDALDDCLNEMQDLHDAVTQTASISLENSLNFGTRLF